MKEIKSILFYSNSLRFLGIILRVLRVEVSVYNVNVTNPFRTTVAHAGGGGKNPLVEVTVNSNRKTLHTLVPITSKNSASGLDKPKG